MQLGRDSRNARASTVARPTTLFQRRDGRAGNSSEARQCQSCVPAEILSTVAGAVGQWPDQTASLHEDTLDEPRYPRRHADFQLPTRHRPTAQHEQRAPPARRPRDHLDHRDHALGSRGRRPDRVRAPLHQHHLPQAQRIRTERRGRFQQGRADGLPHRPALRHAREAAVPVHQQRDEGELALPCRHDRQHRRRRRERDGRRRRRLAGRRVQRLLVPEQPEPGIGPVHQVRVRLRQLSAATTW